jgi:hypothetical protein
MNSRRFLCVLLGLWFGASLWMAFVAIFNFRAVNEILANPQPEMGFYLKVMGPERLRLLLRHEASEVNRALFENWGLVQIGISLVTFGMLLFGTREGKTPLALGLLMVLLSAGMHLFVTPSIVGFGRSLDFVSVDKEPEARRRLKSFHDAYSALEVTKMLAGVALTTMLVRDVRRRKGSSGSERGEEYEAA